MTYLKIALGVFLGLLFMTQALNVFNWIVDVLVPYLDTYSFLDVHWGRLFLIWLVLTTVFCVIQFLTSLGRSKKEDDDIGLGTKSKISI